MKKLYVLLCCLSLVGCATQQPSKPTMGTKTVVYLKGKSTSQIQRIMGKPTLKRVEEPHQLWAYRTRNCSVLVFFNAEGKSQYAEMRGQCERALAKLM